MSCSNVPYEDKYVSFFKGEQKAPENVKINPSATVPFATDGDFVLTESNAILAYAADQSSGGNSQYYPKDLKVRGKINQWVSLASIVVARILTFSLPAPLGSLAVVRVQLRAFDREPRQADTAQRRDRQGQSRRRNAQFQQARHDFGDSAVQDQVARW